MTLTSLTWDPHPHPSPGPQGTILAQARVFSPSLSYAVDMSALSSAAGLVF